jgi:type IV pilus assembly protein PilC
MQFNYQARTKDGLVQVGVVDTTSKRAAADLLQKEGLYVTYLGEEEKRSFYMKQVDFFNKASRKDIMMFCRQLSLMLKSGVTLVDSLRSLGAQTEKGLFRKQIMEIADDVEGGVYLSDALSKHPKVFSNLFINMIKSGEASGKLSESLNYLARHLEREYNLINKIRSGMTYPIIILIVFLIIGGFAIFMVLPSFKETLEALGVPLPYLTRAVLNSGDFIREWWWIVLSVFAGAIFGLWRYVKTKEGKELMGRFFLRAPIIGSLVKKVQLARFTEGLSTLILAGLPITQALDIVSRAMGNKIYQEIVLNAQDGVRRGEPMSNVLETYPKHIPSLVSQMIRVGEKTGRLDESLMSVSGFYQEEVNRGIDGLVEMIEPLLIIVLGGLIAVLMISIIVPVYKGMSTFGF